MLAAVLVFIYVARFLYHPHFYIESTVVTCLVMGVAVRLSFEATWAEALFLGSTMMLCQQAVTSAFIAAAAWVLDDFDQAIQGPSPLAWGIEWAGLLCCLPIAAYLRRIEGPTGHVHIRWHDLLFLCIPLLFHFMTAAEYMPLIDDTYARIPGMECVMVAAMAFATAVAVFLPLELERSAQDDRERAEMRRMVEDYHRRLCERQEADRRMASLMHDLANHVATLDGLGPEERRAYVDDLRGRYLPRTVVYSRNDVLNLVLNDKAEKARRLGVHLSVSVDFSAGVFVKDVDICILFGNALDNAIDAAAACGDPARRQVSVSAFRAGPYLTVEVRNYFDEAPRRADDGSLLSAKRGFRRGGLGLASIGAALATYDGAYLTEVRDGTFLLRMNMPIPEG